MNSLITRQFDFRTQWFGSSSSFCFLLSPLWFCFPFSFFSIHTKICRNKWIYVWMERRHSECSWKPPRDFSASIICLRHAENHVSGYLLSTAKPSSVPRPWLVFCVVRAIKKSDCMRKPSFFFFLYAAWTKCPAGMNSFTRHNLNFFLCFMFFFAPIYVPIKSLAISIWLFITQYMRKFA